MAEEFESPREEPRYVWRDYLTPVVGLIVIIAIVIGIFSAIRGLTARKTQGVATESQVEQGQEASSQSEAENVPTSEIDLGAATQNTYSQAQPAGQNALGGAQAPTQKGGTTTELPKTGFPGAALAALSAILAGVGFKLRKFAKRLQ